MNRVIARVALAGAGLASAALCAMWAAQHLRRAPVIAMHRVEPAALRGLGDDLSRPALTASAEVVVQLNEPTLDTVSALEVAAGRFPSSSFRRHPLSLEQLANVRRSAGDVREEYDSFCYTRYGAYLSYEFPIPDRGEGSWRLVTNNLGLRDDDDVRKAQPGLRVLVVGDSHTDGVCQNAESFANVLEARLAAARPGETVETLNAGRGGYSFFNYLGALERFLPQRPDVFVVGVYGGNDFNDATMFQHAFHGTRRRNNGQEYWSQLEAAGAICPGGLAQSFLSIKEFNESGEQAEIALEAARDVSAEIVVTCQRFGVHPIFVYIPPLPDIEWERHAELLERMLGALELTREQARILDRMADSWIAYVRSIGAEVLDLRSSFRASREPLYWKGDHHINVAAHRIIGELLFAQVDAARPPGAPRVRGVHPRNVDSRLLSPGAASRAAYFDGSLPLAALPTPAHWQVEPETQSVEPLKLDSAVARRLFGASEAVELDARALPRWRANLDVRIGSSDGAEGGWRLRTDSTGRRVGAAPEPARGEATPARVLLIGGAALSGACDVEHTLARRLQERLDAQQLGGALACVDLSAPGLSVRQHSSVLESVGEPSTPVVVAAFDGGQEFAAILALEQHLNGSRSDSSEVVLSLSPDATPELEKQVLWLRGDPRRESRALKRTLELLLDLRRRCKESGAELVVLYLPPVVDVEFSDVAAAFDFDGEQVKPEELHVQDRLASELIARLRQAGVIVSDPRTALRHHPVACFDRESHRLNSEGNRVVAAVLHGAVRSALAGR